MTPEAKRMLQRFRAAEEPNPAAVDRMWEGLSRHVARGQAPLSGIDGSPVALPKLLWTHKLLSSTIAKLAVVTVSMGMGGVAWQWLQPTAAPTVVRAGASHTAEPAAVSVTAPKIEVTQPQSVPSVAAVGQTEPVKPVSRVTAKPSRSGRAPSRPVATRSVGARQVQLDAADVAPQPTAAVVRERASTEQAVTTHAVSEPSTPQPTLDLELALLRRAYTELNSGKAGGALDLIAEHARRFPHGPLEQAREVARMLALCALDRVEDARAHARAFLAKFPGSPFVGRVQKMCPASGGKPAVPSRK